MHESLLRRAYAAFNERDVDRALALMQPDVDWPNVLEGTRALGQHGVRQYWTRQFQDIDPHVEPEVFTKLPDGRVAVDVHQLVRDLEGAVLSDGRVRHVYTIREGLIARMDVEDAP
ncbi:MAG: nuclear transport factor 2 family protein [Solirubrobacterales bacterium]|nr:nuclear transport factor 2 family protein [Solirubrobacterales bacterium]